MADGFQRTSAIGGRAHGRGKGHAREGAARAARGISSCVRAARSGSHPRRAGEDASGRFWCPSAMRGCLSARLRFCAARPPSWRAIWRTTPVTGVPVQACGDTHVGNFGVFASAERNLVFAINDFDETLPGPWEWDLKRLAASAFVAARFLGGDKATCEESARSSVRVTASTCATMRGCHTWTSGTRRIDEKDVLVALSSEARDGAEADHGEGAPAEPRAGTREEGANSSTIEHHIVEDKPLIVRETHTARRASRLQRSSTTRCTSTSIRCPRSAGRSSRATAIVDVARKVVGVGSVGTRCWVRSAERQRRRQRSVIPPVQGSAALGPCTYTRRLRRGTARARRVVVGQRIIQGAPDIFLGWGIQIDGTHFYMRQLRDMKGSWPSSTRQDAVKRVRGILQALRLGAGPRARQIG